MHATEPIIASIHPKPLKVSGALDQYAESFMSTPCIGQEFPKARIVDMLRAPNSDELIRDLAITAGRRGVVFFRAQHDLTATLHKELIQRMGDLSGRPTGHGLWTPPYSEAHDDDPICHLLETSQLRHMYAKEFFAGEKRQTASMAWHSDSAFEPIPIDFSSLRMTTIPITGGDTLWASGYEMYERLSSVMQKTLDPLTAKFSNPNVLKRIEEAGCKITINRGCPENSTLDMAATQPVIRTHPVTGWKSVYGVGINCRRINGLTEQESTETRKKLLGLITENQDLQVRFKWQNSGDIAIWDNRCTFHAITGDQVGSRVGWRVVGVGEKAYLDPDSKSRMESLAEAGEELVPIPEEMTASAEASKVRAAEMPKAEPNVPVAVVASVENGNVGNRVPNSFMAPTFAVNGNGAVNVRTEGML